MSLRELPPADFADDPLLRELAAMAPVPDAGFAALLDERVAGGFADEAGASAGVDRDPPAADAVAGRDRRRIRLRLPSLGPLVAGSLATILIVAILTAKLVSSAGDGGSSGPVSAEGTSTAAPLAAQADGGRGASTGAAATAAAPERGGTGAGSGSSSSSTSTSSGPTATAGGTSSAAGPARDIARDTALAVTARPGRFDAAAARVPQIAAAAGGTVARSIIDAGSTIDAGSFTLRVPAARYESVMAQLSALGTVTRRTEQTQDVTSAIVTADDRLGDLRAERDSLRRRLAATTDDARALELRDRLAAVRRQIARQRAAAVSLHQRARAVPIQLELRGRHAAGAVTPGAADAHGDDADRGAIGQALHDAGRILTAIGAVAIVVLAVIVPLGLVIALAWRGTDLLRRRRREQGLTP
jgi:hypothetical protein